MSTIQELDTLIKSTMSTLPDDYTEESVDDYKKELVNLMALIDWRYNFNDTVEMFNDRLRNMVGKNYNKILLQKSGTDVFGEWGMELEKLPNNASRVDIFSVAPIKALHIVGL